jgi:hypothetical protein
MPIEQQPAAVNVTRCDFPGCRLEERTYSQPDCGYYAHIPKDWKIVPLVLNPELPDVEAVVLCSVHAQHADVVKFVLLVMDRLRGPSGEMPDGQAEPMTLQS